MSSLPPSPAHTIAPTSAAPISPPSSTFTAPTLPSPTVDPGPSPAPAPDPTTKPTVTKKPGKTASTGLPNSSGVVGPSPSSGGGGDDNNNNNNNNNGSDDKKSILAPVIGGVAAVLVVAFLVAVFVMRYKKKSRARKRRLDFLGDHGTAADHGSAGAASPAPGLGALAAGARPPDSTQSRPSGTGNRPLEMAAVGGAVGLAGGAALAHHNKNNQDGYDYQQGYQQVPYGGQYSEHQYDQPGYDQYDPYYSQSHPQPAGYYGDAQQQQQQGYYNDQYTQNQFAPPVPVGYAGAGSSPSMTHATASPKSYPQPPPSTTTGGQSSPRTPQQVPAVPVPGRSSYDKNAKIESSYAGTHSAARNPQVMPQDEEKIKVPVQ